MFDDLDDLCAFVLIVELAGLAGGSQRPGHLKREARHQL